MNQVFTRLRPARAQLMYGAVLGLLAELLLDGAPFGAGYALFAALASVSLIAVGGREAWQTAKESRWLLLGAAALFGATMLNDAHWLNLMNVAAAVFLFSLALAGWNGARPLSELTVGRLMGAPFVTLCHSVVAAEVVLSQEVRTPGAGAWLKRVVPSSLRLLFIVAPPALLLTLLLASGDAVFRERIFDMMDGLRLLPVSAATRGLFVVCGAGLLMTGGLAFALRRRELTEAKAPARRLSATEAYVLLGTLAVVLASFGLVSTPCVLSPSTCSLPPGVTYAKAAHSGFFQLLTAAAGILALLMALPARTKDASPRVLAGFSTLLVVASLPMLLTAWIHLLEYQDTYGLTVLRVLAHSGLALVTAVLLWRALTLWVWQRRFVQGALSLFTFTMLGLSALSPELVIARHNLTGERARGFDLSYELSLSADAVPAFVEAGLVPNNVEAEQSPLHWNLGRARARAALGRE